MQEIFVVDTGVLISMWPSRHQDVKMYTTQSIIEEVLNRPSVARIENMIAAGRLRVDSPESSYIEGVSNCSRRTGDYDVLSDSDRELVALAKSLSESGNRVIVVSTDLALLNTASAVGLDVRDPKHKMKHRIKWIHTCPACGHQELSRALSECPICGTQMKRKPASRTRL